MVLNMIADIERDHIDGPVVAACLLPVSEHVVITDEVPRQRMDAEAEPKREKKVSK